MSLPVALELLRGLETLATLLARMGLAVDLFLVSINHKLVRTGVVTLRIMALVDLNISAFFGVIRQITLKKIS